MPRSPEQLHTPDNSALEEHGRSLAAEVVALKATASTKEDFEQLVAKMQQLERLYETRSPEFAKDETTYEKANEIMGEDFFGFEAFEKAFDLGLDKIPRLETIPYSEAELERAKSKNEMLILRYDIIDDTDYMVNILRVLNNSFNQSDGRVLLDKHDWFENKPFFVKKRIREGWALVSKDIIPNSTMKNYLDQTLELYDYLMQTNSLTEDEKQEINTVKVEELRELMKRDGRAAGKALAELKINQNHRRNPAEALYDFAMRYKNTGERQLETTYDLTNTAIPEGDIVIFGDTNSGGARVHSTRSDDISETFGVVSVR